MTRIYRRNGKEAHHVRAFSGRRAGIVIIATYAPDRVVWSQRTVNVEKGRGLVIGGAPIRIRGDPSRRSMTLVSEQAQHAKMFKHFVCRVVVSSPRAELVVKPKPILPPASTLISNLGRIAVR